MLENKTAVIYGGAGAIGGAVAQAFAWEGAHVVLAGRTRESLARVVDGLRAWKITAQGVTCTSQR